MKKFLLAMPILAILGVMASCQKQEEPKTPDPVATPAPVGTTGWDYKKLCDLPSLPEKSGACMANGLLYVIQDSDNPAQVSVFDLSCKLQRTIKVNAKNGDWEAIACGGGSLIIGEIGDSGPGNTLLTIPDTATGTVTPLVQTFKYADGQSHNAEGLAYDPVRKILMLATKDWDGKQKLHMISSGYATPIKSLTGLPALGEVSVPPAGDYALVTQDESNVFWKCPPDGDFTVLPTLRKFPSGDHEATAFVNDQSFVFMSEDENALYMASLVTVQPEPIPTPAPGVFWKPTGPSAFQIIHADSLSRVKKMLRSDTKVLTMELDQLTREIVEFLHSKGIKVIAYVSAGYEDWRKDAGQYPSEAKGGNICKNKSCTSWWKGEKWGKPLYESYFSFMAKRIAIAAALGVDGAEWDNTDWSGNKVGYTISQDQALSAAKRLYSMTNEAGLAVFAKNNAGLAAQVAPFVQGVYVESCADYNECNSYLPYSGKLVHLLQYDKSCPSLSWAKCNKQSDYFED